MNNNVTVGISDMKLGAQEDVLATYALGSCVGICIYDSVRKVGALGHILLPNSGNGATVPNKYKFADTSVPEMISALTKNGSQKRNLTAKIAGGASMFEVSGESAISNIGERNVRAVREALRAQQIRIIAEDVGLNYGRTVFFHMKDGSVQVKSFAKGLKVL
ncbi:MAG: chemotaxis protein CheD [Anaerofustis sp.]